MANASRLPAIGQGLELLIQRPPLFWGNGVGVFHSLFSKGVRGVLKALARLRVQRIDQHPLGMVVLCIGFLVFGKTPSKSEALPIGGPIGRGGKAIGIDKRFRQEERMTVNHLPIGGEALEIKRENTGRQVFYRDVRQDQETGVIGD